MCKDKKLNIGVLALQGAFIEHIKMLNSLGVKTAEIRKKCDIVKIDGLILPGGESTVISKLLKELELFNPLKKLIQNGLPVLGTCAGLLLLAKDTAGGNPCFATMDIKAVRNAYGRQLDSFSTVSKFNNSIDISMTFIRAPYIKNVGEEVEILATVDNRIVAAKQNNQIAVAFHPELTVDTIVHKYFIDIAKANKT